MVRVVKLVRLSLSGKSISHSTMFFSHNKSTNSSFCHDLSPKQTGHGDTLVIGTEGRDSGLIVGADNKREQQQQTHGERWRGSNFLFLIMTYSLPIKFRSRFR
jgi:hypothetical protein